MEKREKPIDYREVRFHVSPKDPWRDLLPSDLGDLGFESFTDEETLIGYIKDEDWDEQALDRYIDTLPGHVNVNWESRLIPHENWNETWERSFKPIEINNLLYIRASFHSERSDVEHEIIIEPKMAFGTGHHDTTYQIAEALLTFPCEGKKILDMGCGTGILAILAEKRGAQEVTAVDIDPAAVNSTRENIEINGVTQIQVLKADAREIEETGFGVILANINRNIILEHLPHYARMMRENGTLFTSGFYEEDVEVITRRAAECGFKPVNRNAKNKWAMLTFEKQSI